MHKIFDTTANFYKEYLDRCSLWNLDANNITNILINSNIITGEDWHHSYADLPCSYRGLLLVGGDTIRFEINSGGYSSLILGDTSLFLGYSEKDSLFISYAYDEAIEDSIGNIEPSPKLP